MSTSLAFVTSDDAQRWRTALQRRIAEGESTKATAPLADVWRTVLTELDAADAPDGAAAQQPTPDRLLDATATAARLGLKRKQVYNRAARWPFTRRLGKRTLRFSERGLEQWLIRRAP